MLTSLGLVRWALQRIESVKWVSSYHSLLWSCPKVISFWTVFDEPKISLIFIIVLVAPWLNFTHQYALSTSTSMHVLMRPIEYRLQAIHTRNNLSQNLIISNRSLKKEMKKGRKKNYTHIHLHAKMRCCPVFFYTLKNLKRTGMQSPFSLIIDPPVCGKHISVLRHPLAIFFYHLLTLWLIDVHSKKYYLKISPPNCPPLLSHNAPQQQIAFGMRSLFSIMIPVLRV